MSRCYLDANFLIYYKNEDAPQHEIVLSKLAELIKNKVDVFISPLVIDEFIHAMLLSVKKKRASAKGLRELKKSLVEIFSFPFLKIIEIPTDTTSQLKVLDMMKEYNLQPRDAYHLLIMLSNSVDTFATFDKDFHKVFASKIISSLI